MLQEYLMALLAMSFNKHLTEKDKTLFLRRMGFKIALLEEDIKKIISEYVKDNPSVE